MNNEIRISVGGGEEPKWLPDGSGSLLSQRLTVDEGVVGSREDMEKSVSLNFFEGDYVNVWGPSHDIFPDGRILLLELEEWQKPTEIDVIINALDVEP